MTAIIGQLSKLSFGPTRPTSNSNLPFAHRQSKRRLSNDLDRLHRDGAPSEDAVGSKSTFVFILGCLAWYMSSSLSSNTSKAMLSKSKSSNPLFPYPVTLTMIHFAFINVCCAICASRRILGQRAMTRFVQPRWKLIGQVGQLAVFNVAGQALSSLAISRVPVATVHTIKALSPLFTVLCYTFLFRITYSARTYSSLVPLTLGVVMACTGFAFHVEDIVGLSAALASTAIFVAQNIYSKKLLKTQGADKLDKINVLFYSSACSFVLMIPMALYYDGFSLLFLTSTWTGQTGRLTYLIFVNGMVHFAQNILAFNVLAMVSPVTYSIASLLKRVFVIVFAIVWFQQSVALFQWFGILLTFGGLYLYNTSKQAEQQQQQSHGSDKQLLPVTTNDTKSHPAVHHTTVHLYPRQRPHTLYNNASGIKPSQPLHHLPHPIHQDHQQQQPQPHATVGLTSSSKSGKGSYESSPHQLLYVH